MNSEENLQDAPEECTASENLSALSYYLSDVHSLPMLEPDELRALFARIEEVSDHLLQRLTGFGFTVNEYLRMLQQCAEHAAEFDDFFLTSSLPPEMRKKDLAEYCRRWREEITGPAAELKNGFRDTPVPLRQKLTAVMMRHPLAGDLVEEYFNIIRDYVALLGPEPLHRIHPGAIPAATRQLLEERTWMTVEELLPELSALLEEEKELHRLQQLMIESHLRLVISIAKHYRNRGVSFDDLIQEGNLGLLKALKKFDSRLGHLFSTYATWWIRNHILKSLADQSRTIRIPAHMLNAINAIRMAELRYLQKHGEEPSCEALARILELPVARVSALQKMACQAISLQQTFSGDDGEATTLEDLIAIDAADADPVSEFARKILYENLYEILKTLPERDQQILIFRFGLYEQPRLPLAELARRLHLTRERIRKIERRILSQLRDPIRRRCFEGGR